VCASFLVSSLRAGLEFTRPAKTVDVSNFGEADRGDGGDDDDDLHPNRPRFPALAVTLKVLPTPTPGGVAARTAPTAAEVAAAGGGGGGALPAAITTFQGLQELLGPGADPAAADAFALLCTVTMRGGSGGHANIANIANSGSSSGNSGVDASTPSGLASSLASGLLAMGGPTFSSAVGLLRKLRALLASAALGAPTHAAAAAAEACLGDGRLWRSAALGRRLEEQMKPLAVVTGALPAWVHALPAAAPFLWPLEVREQQLRVLGFGVSRGIVAMQEAYHPTRALEEQVRAAFALMTNEAFEKAQRLEQSIQRLRERHATSQLAINTLKGVSLMGPRLLAQAEAVFRDVAFLRSGSLEVRESTRVSAHRSCTGCPVLRCVVFACFC